MEHPVSLSEVTLTKEHKIPYPSLPTKGTEILSFAARKCGLILVILVPNFIVYIPLMNALY